MRRTITKQNDYTLRLLQQPALLITTPVYYLPHRGYTSQIINLSCKLSLTLLYYYLD